MNTNTSTSTSLTATLDQPTFKPAEAVRFITRDPRSGNAPNHVERDIRTLRRAGITPEKVAGRWIVRAGELQRFAAGPPAAPARIDLRRREHRHLRKTRAAAVASAMEVRHG